MIEFTVTRSMTVLPSHAECGTQITIKSCVGKMDKEQVYMPQIVSTLMHGKLVVGEWVEISCTDREVTYVMTVKKEEGAIDD